MGLEENILTSDTDIDLDLLREIMDTVDEEDAIEEQDEVEEKDIIYFNCKKSELTTYQRFLLKKYPKRYKRKKKEPDTVEERLAKRAKDMEKKEQKYQQIIWDEYDEMLKNPKKYYKKRNGLSKKEKAILKFFNDKAKEKPKGKKAKEEAKRKKFAKKSLSNYFFIKEQDERFNEILTKSSQSFNPNKKFVKSAAAKTYDAKKVALLKTLEEEILEHLSDPLAFDPNNVVVQYNDHNKKKKEKKRKKQLKIDRFII